MTDVWVDLVLLKALHLSFELKPTLPLVWTPNEAEMILVGMNDSILRPMVGAMLAYESNL